MSEHRCGACGSDRFPIIDLAMSIIRPATPVVLWLRCPACHYGWPDPAVSTTSAQRQAYLLLARLELINAAFARMGVPPLVTLAEANALPDDNIAGIVAASADHLAAVTRKLSGIV